jgi:DNA replication protein DnaC
MKLKEKVLNSLNALKYTGMHEALVQQLKTTDCENMSFLERLDDMLVQEINNCQNKRIAYLTKQAKLRWPNASIQDIRYQHHTSLKQAKISELAELAWIQNGLHLVITGPTGTGKTYIACALAVEAITQTVPVLYFRFNELILNLVAANKNEKLTAFQRRLIKAPLLIIDDWGISPLNALERHLLFELIECRDKKGSMIITSQYPVKAWYEAFQDPTIADATLDRIVHQTHEIVLKGESLRKVMGIKGDKQ